MCCSNIQAIKDFSSSSQLDAPTSQGLSTLTTNEALTNSSTTGIIQKPHASNTSILIYPIDSNEIKSGPDLLDDPVQGLCVLCIVSRSFVAVEDVELAFGL